MAELYFIVLMFVLIALLCIVSTAIFAWQYRKETREKQARLAAKKQAAEAKE